MNTNEIELISHCLGIDINSKNELPKEFYRNYFCLQRNDPNNEIFTPSENEIKITNQVFQNNL